MDRNVILSILACAGALLMAGCTQTIRLKVVDASNGRPLAGVSVSARQIREKVFRTVKQVGPVNLPPSERDGVIDVGRLHRSWVTQFVISCPGYATVYGDHGTTQGGGLWLSTQASYSTADFPGDPFAGAFFFKGNGNAELASKTNGFFLVRMQK